MWVEGTPIPRLRTRKGQALLAHLLLKHPASVQRDWLAGTLWPDSPEEQSRLSLRQSLNDLRKALGSMGECIVSSTSRTLAIEIEGAEVDVLEFLECVQHPAHSLDSDMLAIGLYGGHL